MSDQPLIDRLDAALQRLLQDEALPVPAADEDALTELVDLAGALRNLPDPRFRARLAVDLERSAAMTTTSEPTTAASQTATATLRFRSAAAAIEFYQRAFGAHELMRFADGSRIPHAELAIGNSILIVADEAPGHGYRSAESIGGSPIMLRLYVDDADAMVDRALAAGATLQSPVTTHFYGDRSGVVVDPFGYGWTVATRQEHLTVDEMHRRLGAMRRQPPAPSDYRPEGFLTVTPYLVAQDAPGLIDFVLRTFEGEEIAPRSVGSAGGVHTVVRVGDSMLMIGGGAPNLAWRGESKPAALHVYVADTDMIYERALQAGATSIDPPADRPYGERSAGVRDAFGNNWYIATPERGRVPEGLHSVNTCLHPLRAEPVMTFLSRAFGATTIDRHQTAEGVVMHATVRVGDSVLEIGEAHGPYQPMTSTFYVYLPDVDDAYRRALRAGATSVSEPRDQPYGDRNGAFQDAFGNVWYVGRRIKEA